MKLLKQIRSQLIQELWRSYKQSLPAAATLATALEARGEKIILDHLAIIDLPSRYSGIPTLVQIFSALGYIVQGCDYLPEKQNDFTWMVESDALDQPVNTVLPQVVVADFRLDELPISIRKIIESYTAYIKASPLREIQQLSGKAFLGDHSAATQLLQLLHLYFTHRQWPLPTVADFQQVREANELLAWVLVFGHIPNHFTISSHLMSNFPSFSHFIRFVEHELLLPLNQEEGKIKGNSKVGIQQASTIGSIENIELADSKIFAPGRFIEFVWRYSLNKSAPCLWNDYFTGFISSHANRVIESLYRQSTVGVVEVR